MHYRIILMVLGVLSCAHVEGLGQLLGSKNSDRAASASPQEKICPLREILALLEKVYDVRFLYEDSLLEGKTGRLISRVSNNFFNDLSQALDNSALTYETVGTRTIVIVPKTPANRAVPPYGIIRGKVTNEAGEKIPYAQVISDNLRFGAAANAEGEYVIANAPIGRCKLRARVIGRRSQEATVIVAAGETVSRNFVLTTDALSMQEIVVTGTRNPMTKLESSVAISTANAAQIAERAPRNTADLLRVIPGFYVESSGGEGGNNLFARGIPADGSFRYVTMYENGLPIFEAPELAFANIDELMRVDETIEVMEAVRGSTAAIFASNAPAGIVNFISKTGGPTFSGTAKTTVGDYGLFRTEANFGGPLGNKWLFDLGGFYRYDRGIRAPGFPANRGGQLKANVTRHIKNGYFRLYAKWLNDHNIFYAPIPLQNHHHPQAVAGFDPNFGTLASTDFDFIKAPAPGGRTLEFDLRDGIHPAVRSLGLEFSLTLGEGWTIKNSMQAMAADLQVNAIFSIFNPATARQFAQEKMKLVPGAAGFKYRFVHSPDQIFDPAAANGNGLVVESGWWAVRKPLRNFINHLQLTKRLGRHALTGGVYCSDYSADDFWYWQNILLEVRDHPRALDLMLTDANGNDLISVTRDGFTQFGTVYFNARNKGFVGAHYLHDEWNATAALRVEGGVRYEYHTLSGVRENHQVFDLDDAATLADDRVVYGNGTFRPYDFSYQAWALSIGGNYSVSPHTAFYARGSKGFRMPDFDQFRSVNTNEDLTLEKGEVEEVLQFEGGIKIFSPQFSLFGALFFSRLDNLPFTDEVIDPLTGQLKTARRFANSATTGAELEAICSPVKGLGFDLIATLQDPRLRDLAFTIGGSSMNFDGNRVRRIPRVIVDFKPSYKISNFGMFGNLRYIGERFVDDANAVTLPDYVELHAGASYSFPRFSLALNAANLTNTIGLTEGNPRVGQVVGVRQDIYMARPILGRTLTFSTTYSF